MTMYRYYAVIEPDEDVFFVRFPDLESCHTQGDTLQEAVFMAEDVLGLMLSSYEADGDQIPAPSKPVESYLIEHL